MDYAGFGWALWALVFFGLYMVPRKLARMSDLPFVLTMSVGVVLTTGLAGLLSPAGSPAVGSPARWLAFLCGPIWYLGVLFYAMSVTRMGLALSTPIKNTTAVLGALIGLLVFAEWRETQPVLTLAGSLLVVLCAVILAQTGENDCRRSCVTPAGVACALAAAVFFAAYTIPFKIAQQAGLDTLTLVAYMGLGTLAAAVVCFALFDRGWAKWRQQPLAHHTWAALAGLIWVLAVICMAEAIKRIGLAITWPFTNLNTVVTVACGIIVFREISVRKFWKTILLGLMAGVAGVVLLGLARL
jgi:glucose uptake protein